MKKVTLIISLLVGYLVQGCDNVMPTKEEIVGLWLSVDGSSLQFLENGSFVAKKLKGEIMFAPSDRFQGKLFNESGKWRIANSQGNWEVELNFEPSSGLNNGFDTSILIGRARNPGNNKSYIYLYEWIKEEGGERYIFEKQR